MTLLAELLALLEEEVSLDPVDDALSFVIDTAFSFAPALTVAADLSSLDVAEGLPPSLSEALLAAAGLRKSLTYQPEPLS